MPPKNKSSNARDDVTQKKNSSTSSDASRKRTHPTGDEPNKAPRRSGRGTSKSKSSEEDLLQYMLSKDAEDFSRPDDESEYIKDHGDARTYSSSALNPFEELLCAAILSRPISHRLGLRTIRTVLNEPYNFTSAKAIRDAGNDRVHEAVWEAKTQHKQKTAEEISHVADVVLDKYSSKDDPKGTNLRKLLDDNDGDIEEALASLRGNVKGLGPTALNIFHRRVQWLWDAGFPFVDARTAQSLKKLGLPTDAAQLEKLIERRWASLDTKNLAGDGEAAKKRRAFVVILERAVGADLEGKVEGMVDAAGSTP